MEDNYIGVIKALGFQFAPREWGYCSGGLLSIPQFEALFSLLGREYGGDGVTVFGLPDLRGRVPSGQFTGPGGLTPRVIGERYGTQLTALTVLEMPAHTHSVSYGSGGAGGGTDVVARVSSDPGKKQEPAPGDYLASAANNFGVLQDNIYSSAPDISSTINLDGFFGGTGTFNNSALSIDRAGAQSRYIDLTQPGTVLNYCICMFGLYPSRS